MHKILTKKYFYIPNNLIYDWNFKKRLINKIVVSALSSFLLRKVSKAKLRKTVYNVQY